MRVSESVDMAIFRRVRDERDAYREALERIAALTLSEKPRAVPIAREALNVEAGKR